MVPTRRSQAWANPRSDTRRSSGAKWSSCTVSGRSFNDLAAAVRLHELVDPHVGQAGGSRWAGKGDGGLTTAEREELSRLRRENRKLREEREILSKAAAWFANEKPATPKRSSDS